MNKWMDKLAEYVLAGAAFVKNFALPLGMINLGIACMAAAMQNGYVAALGIVVGIYFLLLSVRA